MLIDTHCHLNHERLAGDAGDAIERAVAVGVTRMVVVGYDMPSSEKAVELASSFEPLFAAVAVHPHDSRLYGPDAEWRLRELAACPKVVAIGEIGLDYHYDFSPVADQRRAFTAQLSLARDVGLPVIVHCREAYADVLDSLEAEMDRRIGGVMHCWAGSSAEAERSLGLGLHLGFGGVLTFRSAEDVRETARLAPLDRIVVETDAPYLAPAPHRGERNEPAYTRIAAEKLAEVRRITVEEVAEVTTANAGRLFPRLMIDAAA